MKGDAGIAAAASLDSAMMKKTGKMSAEERLAYDRKKQEMKDRVKNLHSNTVLDNIYKKQQDTFGENYQNFL